MMDVESKIKGCMDLTPAELQFSRYILANQQKIVDCTMQDYCGSIRLQISRASFL